MTINSLGDLFRAIKTAEVLDGPVTVFDRFLRVETAHCYLVHNHGGQGTWEYAALSALDRSADYPLGHSSDAEELMRYVMDIAA